MNSLIRIEKLVYGGEGLSRVDGEVVLTPFSFLARPSKPSALNPASMCSAPAS